VAFRLKDSSSMVTDNYIDVTSAVKRQLQHRPQRLIH
jgi:hypothetical protein